MVCSLFAICSFIDRGPRPRWCGQRSNQVRCNVTQQQIRHEECEAECLNSRFVLWRFRPVFFAREEGKECAKSPSQRQGYSYWLERWLWALKPPRPAPCYPRQRITRLSKGSPAAAQAHVAHGGGLGYAVHIAAAVPRAAGIGAPGVISRSPQHQREAASIGGLLFATPSVLNRDIPYRNRIARVGCVPGALRKIRVVLVAASPLWPDKDSQHAPP
jgi:hypothetical protein